MSVKFELRCPACGKTVRVIRPRKREFEPFLSPHVKAPSVKCPLSSATMGEVGRFAASLFTSHLEPRTSHI